LWYDFLENFSEELMQWIDDTDNPLTIEQKWDIVKVSLYYMQHTCTHICVHCIYVCSSNYNPSLKMQKQNKIAFQIDGFVHGPYEIVQRQRGKKKLFCGRCTIPLWLIFYACGQYVTTAEIVQAFIDPQTPLHEQCELDLKLSKFVQSLIQHTTKHILAQKQSNELLMLLQPLADQFLNYSQIADVQVPRSLPSAKKERKIRPRKIAYDVPTTTNFHFSYDLNLHCNGNDSDKIAPPNFCIKPWVLPQF
ncbi:hypothetical protein RFI_17597, partial [Reticulomyxa filosa]